MKKKSFTEKMMASGIWILPFTMMLSYKVFKMLDPNFMDNKLNVFACIALATMPIFYIWADQTGRPNEDEAMIGKHKAMYPEISKELLRNELAGTIPLGWDKRSKRYVCKPLEEDGHVFLIGGKRPLSALSHEGWCNRKV